MFKGLFDNFPWSTIIMILLLGVVVIGSLLLYKKMQKRAGTCLLISAALIAIALVLSLCNLGINMGIDFAGGLSIKYDMGDVFEDADIEAALKNAGIKDYQIVHAGSEQHELQLRVKSIDSEEGVETLRTSIEGELVQKYTEMKTNDATVSYVGGTASTTLLKNAVLAVLIAAACMLIYIALRFDLGMGAAAVLGLVHDVLIMLAFMVFFRSFMQMNSTFVAAMLTIVGYSINNTIIIFDRVRENHNKTALASLSRVQIVEKSVKESLGRTINTTLTTLVTILALYILGVDSIKEFALPIIIGILAGAYSANLINGYIWAVIPEKKVAKAVR